MKGAVVYICFVLLLLFIGTGCWFAAYAVGNAMKGFKAPVCEQWVTQYYWHSWAGNSYPTGTSSLEAAREEAGNNPLSEKTDCAKWTY